MLPDEGRWVRPRPSCAGPALEHKGATEVTSQVCRQQGRIAGIDHCLRCRNCGANPSRPHGCPQRLQVISGRAGEGGDHGVRRRGLGNSRQHSSPTRTRRPTSVQGRLTCFSFSGSSSRATVIPATVFCLNVQFVKSWDALREGGRGHLERSWAG